MGRTMDSQCSSLSPPVILVTPLCPVLITSVLLVLVSAEFQVSQVGCCFIWGTTGNWIGSEFQMWE